MNREKTVRMCAVLACLLAHSGLFAYFNVLDVPDTASIRTKIRETWLEAPLSELRSRQPETVLNSAGQLFQIRVEESGGELAIVITPRQLDLSFPSNAAGSWVLCRDGRTGELLRIRLYFQPDPQVYAQFRKERGNVVADFLLYGTYAVRGASVALSFDRLFSMTFADVVSFTADFLPWKYVKIDPRLYYPSLQMIAVIRENLYRFEYIEDAAYDAYGKPVFISTGEPREDTPGKRGTDYAGFLKWIIDGLVEPSYGGFTLIDPLKKATFPAHSQRQTILSAQSVFLGLDWCRNLASAAISINSGYDLIFPASGTDVTDSFFAARETAGGIENVPGYAADAGYEISLVKPLLYVLAALYPDRFYLAAVRTVEQGQIETVRFNHAAALFPYFAADGSFQIAVFESGSETTFEEFVERNKGSFLHLSRVKASERFFPQ